MNRRVTETAADAPRPVAPIGIDALVAGALLLAGAIVFLWYAPASYQIYLALHILAVVVWVGGDITLTTLGIVFESKQDGPTLAALGRMGSWIGTRVYTPALFFVFGFGVALVEKSGIGWNHFWIIFAVVGWALAMLIGIGVRRPRARPDRQGGAGVRARIAGGGAEGQAAVHDLPLRHRAADPGRHRHGGEAVVLSS